MLPRLLGSVLNAIDRLSSTANLRRARLPFDLKTGKHVDLSLEVERIEGRRVPAEGPESDLNCEPV